MMNFRLVKDAIITILTAQSGSNFQTKKSQKQSIGAIENVAIPRLTVYYQSGSFPKSSASIGSNRVHEALFRCQITVVSKAKADLSVINNPGASAVLIATALAAITDASDIADELLDETIDNVYQILMSALNQDLGLSKGIIRDLWVDPIQKDEPLTQGEFLILTGSIDLTCRIDETVKGDSGVPGIIFDNTIHIKDDPNNNAGASGNLGG